MIPPPSAVIFVGLSTDPSSILWSSTVTLTVSRVVVVPLTVRLRPTKRSPVIFASPVTLTVSRVVVIPLTVKCCPTKRSPVIFALPERTLFPPIDKSSPTFKLFSILKSVLATIESPVE